MTINSDKDAIIVNISHVPVIRAGYFNVIFLLLAFALILANQILIDLNVAVYTRLLVLLIICLVTLKVYNHSVSKLYLKNNNSLIVIGPFFTSIIPASKIEATKVYGIPSSMTIFLQIKRNDAKFPVIYFFIAISTNQGSYKDTKLKLVSLLGKLNSVG